MSDIREASLEPGAERLPGGVIGQAAPFCILAAGALWLASRWDQLPARLPVHWNWRGEVDHVVDRSVIGAGLPLILGVAVCALMLGLQLGIVHGAPRAAMRASIVKLVLGGEYFIAMLCCAVLAPMVTGGRLLAPVLVASFAGVVVLLVTTWLLARHAPRPPVRNPGSWHAGFIYVNREDPALLVPKRLGVGYTFNFGNPLAVAMMLATLALPLLALLLALTAR